VSSAAAKIGLEPRADLSFVGCGIFHQERLSPHHHAGDAIAALGCLLLNKSLLYRRRVLYGAKPFQRYDLIVLQSGGWRYAGAWQRWISAKSPKVSRTARLSALAPSTMNKRTIFDRNPRSTRSASNALTTAAFSVAPSATASTCLSPAPSMPIAATNTWSPTRSPSIWITSRSSPDRSTASHSFSFAVLSATNRRDNGQIVQPPEHNRAGVEGDVPIELAQLGVAGWQNQVLRSNRVQHIVGRNIVGLHRLLVEIDLRLQHLATVRRGHCGSGDRRELRTNKVLP
jgi:hypothetical protein